MKKYKAIFFDWDGTAVKSRKAPVEEAVRVMKPLLENGVKLIIVSGTTVENIAGGRLQDFFTDSQLENLYLGLGRGAYDYCYKNGELELFSDCIPEGDGLLKIHDICYEIHRELLAKYKYETDVVFSRPNYCKIDLMVNQNRGDNLFMQENELLLLRERLKNHGINGGLQSLIDLSEAIGKNHDVKVSATCDAKYLEVGISDKSNNVNTIFDLLEQKYGIRIEDCAFLGDEFLGIEPGIYGSDSYMITSKTRKGDFYDVSDVQGERPKECQSLGGGINRFLEFMEQQCF